MGAGLHSHGTDNADYLCNKLAEIYHLQFLIFKKMENKKISARGIIAGSKKGATFIELLLYISIFLILTPILMTVSINSVTMEKQNVSENQISADSRFVVERIYDLISSAKRINAADSVLDSENGRISLVMNDNSSVVVALNSGTQKIQITEGGVTSDLSSGIAKVKRLYFEKMPDDLDNEEIALGVNVRIQMTGLGTTDVPQDYVVSANLEHGDYDEDGCPDFMDKSPEDAQCCGDIDGDGVCDEKDNCIDTYNPFQEDYDLDSIGDACDSAIFFEGGGEGGSGGNAFNCSPDDGLISLLNLSPAMNAFSLKQILMASSPLSPTVLIELTKHPTLMPSFFFKDIFVANVKLPAGVMDAINAMNPLYMNPFDKQFISNMNNLATIIPWFNLDKRNYSTYQVALYSDAPVGQTWKNRIKFYNSDSPLGTSAQNQKTDVFTVVAENGSDTVSVALQTAGGTETHNVTVTSNYVEYTNGYTVELDQRVGNSYALLISSSFAITGSLTSAQFNFGTGANVTQPAGTTYKASRYTAYCSGGCETNCGDVGTGIINTGWFLDRCYTWNYFFPEWCAYWYTEKDDNNDHPAFEGGTQTSEQSYYWEKTFKTMLTAVQLSGLESITVAGDVAYQSTAQFFCDKYGSSCPMNGTLVGSQDVELYNWNTHSWTVIGSTTPNGASSSQQKFEVVYKNSDAYKFVGTFGFDTNTIKARVKFRWKGVPPQGQLRAPCFRLVDYMTMHLKW
jgi:hypothetical protein